MLHSEKGINFIFEAILVMFLFLLLIIGFGHYHTKNEVYNPALMTVEDALIIFSAENTIEESRLIEIGEFIWPQKDVELYVGDNRIFGTLPNDPENKNCFIRMEHILVSENDIVTSKEFKIKYCD